MLRDVWDPRLTIARRFRRSVHFDIRFSRSSRNSSHNLFLCRRKLLYESIVITDSVDHLFDDHPVASIR